MPMPMPSLSYRLLRFFFSFFSTCFSFSLDFTPMCFLYFVAVGHSQERFVGIGFGRLGWGGTRGLNRNDRGGDFGLGVRYRPAVRIVADGCPAGTARQRGAYLALTGLLKSAKKDKTRASQTQQDRVAYWIAESGSATDSVTQAMTLKMATTVDARIISDLVKRVEI